MRMILRTILAGLSLVAAVPTLVQADFPKPAVYPASWELKFEHATPKRISVNVPGEANPKAYWYMTFTVTNPTTQTNKSVEIKEQQFLPVFEMVTNTGQIVRSDQNVPNEVFNAIKNREKIPLLEPLSKVSGTLRLGPDQARDSVAIFPEVERRMGKFNIFVQGLTGEFTTTKLGDKDVILRKTLQLNFFVRGDDVYPGEDAVNDEASTWIMR